MSSLKEESDVLERQRKYLAPAVSTYYEEPLVLDHGQGLEVYDQANQRYLDFFGGILTVSIGHAHPEVINAVTDQVQKLSHTSTLYVTEPMVDLAERLAALTPGELEQSFFTTSGSEANETAVTMAQEATGFSEVIALRHSYSGRSAMAMTLTGQASWRLGLSGLPGIRHAHNAYCYRCPFGKKPDSCGLECAKDLNELIATETRGQVGAFIAEPIQGVGGFITPPDTYFQEASDIVRRHGALFIDDEVQTGFGRTGKMFGIEHSGVVPDMMTFAKGLANGLPIGATITTRRIAASYKGPTISTFGGNPISMRAALATLTVIERDQLMQNALAMGHRLRAGLETLQEEFPFIGDVRGKGLMQGLEFVRDDKKPAPDVVLRFFEATKARGLLLGKGGLWANTVRIAPALTVTASQVSEALDTIREALTEIVQRDPDLALVQRTH